MYEAQMISITHYSLKTVSLKMVSAVGIVGQRYIPRIGEGRRGGAASDCLSPAPGLMVTPSPRPPPSLF